MNKVKVLNRDIQPVFVLIGYLDELPVLPVHIETDEPVEYADAVIRVDDVVALTKVLEVRYEGPAGRPADQHPFLGEDVAFGKVRDPLRGKTPSPVQVAEEQENLRGLRLRERTDLLFDLDLVLGKKGGDLLPDHRVGQKYGAALSRPLQPFHVFDKKGDLVFKAGH